jgi:hypothetical protein
MSDYRDERIALEQRASELDEEKRSLEAALAERTGELLALDIELAKRPSPAGGSGALFIAAGLVVAIGVALVATHAVRPPPAAARVCPSIDPPQPRSLVLWGTLSKASTVTSHGEVRSDPTEGSRCEIHFESESSATRASFWIACGGVRAYTYTNAAARHLFSVDSLVATLRPLATDHYDLDVSSTWREGELRIDTRSGVVRYHERGLGRDTFLWDIALDGAAEIRRPSDIGERDRATR